MDKEQILTLAVTEGLKHFDNWQDDGKTLMVSEFDVTEQVQRTVFASIASYKAELLKEVGEPVAWVGRIEDGAMLLMSMPDDWVATPLFDSDQVAAAILKAIKPLEEEVARWKNHHETEVRRARILKERTDMPIERVQAYEKWGEDQAQLAAALEEIERLKSENRDACFGLHDYYKDQLATAEQRVAGACADYINSRVEAEDDADLDIRDIALLSAAGAIRSSEYRKFMKEV